MDTSKSINPATGELIQEYTRLSNDAVTHALQLSHHAFLEWRETSFAHRASLMHRAADVLETDKKKYARLITTEMGKLFSASIKEIEKCVWVMRYFADNAEKFLQIETVPTEARKSFVTFNPLGVILAVMPWNFPFFQVIRFAAPAFMAGNTVVLKHASNVQGCAEAITSIFTPAGFPEYAFTNLNITGEQVSQAIENPVIAAVTLTGSDAAGSKVAAIAGKALKKCVLELGGSDAYIVLEDAPLDKAVDMAVTARLQNNGQTCIAAKRFIVVKDIYEAFLEKFVNAMQSKIMGDPFDEDSFYGPLSRMDLRDDLHKQVVASVRQGAVLKTGGYIPDAPGAYYPATVLANVQPGMTAFDEELFGPVAAVIKATDEQDAIALANRSKYGLGATIVTANIARGEKIAANNIEAGSVFVNHIVASDPRLPFGGVKHSGYGRELSAYGIKEFVNIKTVWIDEMQ